MKIREGVWDCTSCSALNRGRDKSCTTCGSPRESDELVNMRLPSTSEEKALVLHEVPKGTDLYNTFTEGANWICTHCGSGNPNSLDRCENCAAPRYGESKEDLPGFEGQHKSHNRAHLDESNRPTPRLGKNYKKKPSPQNYKKKPEVNPEPPPLKWYESLDHRHLYGFMGAIGFILFIWFLAWAFSTHLVEGQVAEVTWAREVKIDAWTQIQVRKWQHETIERKENPTVSPGMTLLGECSSEYYGESPRYQCGTKEESYDCSYSESYSATCTGTRSVSDGESCSSNGNGGFSCYPKTRTESYTYSCQKSRRVSKTCTRTVPKYCTDPVYKQKCTYRTQTWKTARLRTSSGANSEPKWPVYTTGPLERASRSSDYSLTITYKDPEPDYVNRTLKGINEYQKWFEARESNAPVYLQVNNLGGVHSYSLQKPL